MTEPQHTENSSYRIFFERTFDPIALYHVGPSSEYSREKTRFIDVNEAYEKVMKIRREDVIGRSFREVWPQAEKYWENIIDRCVITGRMSHTEGYSADSNAYLEAIALFLPPDRATVIFIDKTQWKKSDDELKRKQGELLRNRGRLRELAARLTLAEEHTRRSIATDLHDHFGYKLVALLRSLRQIHEGRMAASLREEVKQAIDQTEELIGESRSLIFKLSPPILLEVGLDPALEALADQLLTPQGIKWTLHGKDASIFEQPAEDAICVLLYRMTRELLINVIKHSKATIVTIKIHRGPGKIQVVVEDDGVGFDAVDLPPFDHACYGLFSIRERLITIGGDLTIVSLPGKGTTIAMTAPRHLSVEGVKP